MQTFVFSFFHLSFCVITEEYVCSPLQATHGRIQVCVIVYLIVCVALYVTVCVTVYVTVCVTVYVTVYVTVCIVVYVTVCVTVYVTVCVTLYVTVCVTVYVTVCITMYVTVCVTVCVTLYVTVCVTVYVTICIAVYVRSKMSWAEDHFSDCIAIVIAFKEWKNAKISGRFDLGGKVSPKNEMLINRQYSTIQCYYH